MLELYSLSWQWFIGLTAFIPLWNSLPKSVMKKKQKKNRGLAIVDLSFK